MSAEGVNQNNVPLSEEERARIAQVEKERAFSDAELLKRGAEYVVDENGEKRLEVTEWQERQIEHTSNSERVKKIIADLNERREYLRRNDLANGHTKESLQEQYELKERIEFIQKNAYDVILKHGHEMVLFDLDRYSIARQIAVEKALHGESGPELQKYVERVEKVIPERCLTCISDAYEPRSEAYNRAENEINSAINDLFSDLSIEPKEFFGSERMNSDPCYYASDVISFVNEVLAKRQGR